MPTVIHLKNRDFGLIVILIVASIFTVFFSYVNILKFKIFSPTCFGWAYFYSYLKIAEGRSIFSIYIRPEYPVMIYLLGPINYLFAFIYTLVRRPEMLLVSQTIIMAAGSIPVYLLAKYRLHNIYLAVVLAVAYLLHPVITTGAMLGYITFSSGMLFLLFAFYYLAKANFRRFIIFVLLANASKVDVIVMTLILGVILAFSEEKRRYGKSVFLISFFWLLIVIGICSLYLNLTGEKFPVPMLHLAQYGCSMTEVFRYALNNPLSVLGNLFNQRNMLYYVFTRLPNIFSFLSPMHLLPVIPETGFILLRNQHSSGLFLMMPFIFVGGIYGIEKAFSFINKAFICFFKKEIKADLMVKVGATIILVVVLLQHYFVIPKHVFGDRLGPIPFTRDFTFKAYEQTEHIKIGYRFLKMVPSEGSCLTLQSLAPHLGNCEFLGIFAIQTLQKDYRWDYMLVDLFKEDFYNLSRGQYYSKLKWFLKEDDYGVLAFEDGWLLLKRRYKSDKNEKVLKCIEEILYGEKKI